MANSISSVTTGTGGIVLESVDTSGNTNIKSGTTTIVAVTSTGAAVTGTLSASGGIAKASLPTGSVLQVVNATYSTQVSNATSTYASSGLAATITPTSATSKIFIIINTAGNTNASGGANYTIFKASSNLVALGLAILANPSTTFGVAAPISLSYLDSPATTSATTYTLYFNNGGSGTATVQLSSFTGVITLMEIAA
jgi:hypothetical protein